jgi:hypothetical protein
MDLLEGRERRGDVALVSLLLKRLLESIEENGLS